ncbi:dolichol phosphate-mannose biosynthesis regulatory protein [Oryzias latipes]|uniref:dolichol phosphate-mannose biosynthesis regulatory protein n=1 Tax=Oryzias latipes TaxID=8090 RepID=UPI000CE1E7BD|nr:dolichol phosphate-mannose biosynthesis regulatory protein [Oryzias latipes]
MTIRGSLTGSLTGLQKNDRNVFSSRECGQNGRLATGVDQAVGMGLVLFSLALFSYYSVWVVVLPFMDGDHMLQQYFLPREYSVILPGIAAVVLLLMIGAFTAAVVWMNHKPKKVD